MRTRVILVDDHILFLEGLSSILAKELGIEIIGTAKNGIELFNLVAREEKPHVILSDIRMPIMDGVTITKLMKKEYPAISVIALSMLDQESEVMAMLDAGAKGYIVKNAEKKELVDAIHSVANGNFYVSRKFQPIYKRWCSRETDKDELKITRREQQILILIALGRSSLEIAKELHLSRFTVDTHRKNIHKKLGIKSNVGLARYAQKWLNVPS